MDNWQSTKQELNENKIETIDFIPENILIFLKNNIKKEKKYLFNKDLIGHIKKEYFYEHIPNEINDFFIEKIFKSNILKNHLSEIQVLSKHRPLLLKELWCNFMKKYEFNPLHTHSGVFSFIIFLKIPYDLHKENKFFNVIDEKSQNSMLNFVLTPKNTFANYLNIINLPVDKSFENKLIIFPSNFAHSVYPFYTTNQERITVSGNIYFSVN